MDPDARGTFDYRNRYPPPRAQLRQRRSCDTEAYVRNQKRKALAMHLLFFLVAETGFEPRDLRVMSPTSYQAALLRDMGCTLRELVPETGVEPARYFRITGF